ncbi:hypothetical protein ElyMa_000464900, partial [Elysia marginata]
MEHKLTTKHKGGGARFCPALSTTICFTLGVYLVAAGQFVCRFTSQIRRDGPDEFGISGVTLRSPSSIT